MDTSQIQKLNLEEKLFPYLDHYPKLGQKVFLASGVKIIGKLRLAIIPVFGIIQLVRGDVNYIEIG